MSPAGLHDAAQHSSEHELMERINEVPIGAAQQAGRLIYGRLTDPCSGRSGLSGELQPGTSRQLHLASQQQPPIRLERFNTPAIHRVSDAEQFRVPAPAAHADSTQEEIDCSPEPPQPVAVVPAGQRHRCAVSVQMPQ